MDRLRKRAEFLAVAGGRKSATGSLVLQALPRKDAGPARFGFTVTRKVGNAVERNRVRRRLRAAVSQVAPDAAQGRIDYVVIGRQRTLNAPFERILTDLRAAFVRVHSEPSR